MSLYNLICGNNPAHEILHAILETVEPLPNLPRYRDTYTIEKDGKIYIVIYTRTGGGNREEFESENRALTSHPMYVNDYDDDFDNTFAHFEFLVPDSWQARVISFHNIFSRSPKGMTPRQKFQRQMDAMSGKQTEVENPLTELEMQELQSIVEDMIEDLNMN
jgi:hypothetical protein